MHGVTRQSPQNQASQRTQVKLNVLDLESVRFTVDSKSARVLGDRLDELVGDIEDELCVNQLNWSIRAERGRTSSTSSSMLAPGQILCKISLNDDLGTTLAASSLSCAAS